MVDELKEYVLSNRAVWDKLAVDYAKTAREDWQGEPAWGIWRIPETEAHILPNIRGWS